MPSLLPRQVRWKLVRSYIPIVFGLPRISGGSAPVKPFSRPAQRSHCYGLQICRVAFATLYTRGFSSFAASAAAPIATGWSEPVPGRDFHPLWISTFSRRTEIMVATTMSSLFVAFFALIASTFRTRAALQAEILALRHQLAVFQKNAPRRLRLHRFDRLLWVVLYRCWSGWRRCLEMVQPDTVLRWHHRAFAWHWTRKARRLPGGPEVAANSRDLIRRMSQANPLWGAPRIHGELLKLWIAVAQSTVARYLPRRRKPPCQTWRTFLTNHLAQTAAVDFFTVPTATFRVLFVFVVLASA
jgi:hypothetical protein